MRWAFQAECGRNVVRQIDWNQGNPANNRGSYPFGYALDFGGSPTAGANQMAKVTSAKTTIIAERNPKCSPKKPSIGGPTKKAI